MSKAKNTGLGRGLGAIFADNTEEVSSGITMIRVADIQPRADQPRKHFDSESLSALAASVAEHGLIQPIAVRASAGGFYEIVAGERRWRAAKMAGLSEVPAMISDFDDRKTAEIALIENIQREDLSAVEEAMGYRALMEEYGLTQEQVAERIGKSRPAIANTLRLLELPDAVLEKITGGQLSAGHARAMLALSHPDRISECMRTVLQKGLSVRQTEALVRSFNRARPAAPAKGAQVDYIGRLERKAQALLGRKVKITRTGRAKKIELSYENDEDLEGLLTALCGKDIFDD